MKLPDYLNNPTIQLLEKIQASMPQIPTSVQRATELNSKIPTVYNDLLSDIENRILNINLSKSDKERQAHRVQKFIAAITCRDVLPAIAAICLVRLIISAGDIAVNCPRQVGAGCAVDHVAASSLSLPCLYRCSCSAMVVSGRL